MRHGYYVENRFSFRETKEPNIENEMGYYVENRFSLRETKEPDIEND